MKAVPASNASSDARRDLVGQERPEGCVPERSGEELQRVTIPEIDLAYDVADGDEIRTEISANFRSDGLRRELSAAGLGAAGWWTDPAGDYARSLCCRHFPTSSAKWSCAGTPKGSSQPKS